MHYFSHSCELIRQEILKNVAEIFLNFESNSSKILSCNIIKYIGISCSDSLNFIIEVSELSTYIDTILTNLEYS